MSERLYLRVERHHKVIMTSEETQDFYKPWVSKLEAWKWENMTESMGADFDVEFVWNWMFTQKI